MFKANLCYVYGSTMTVVEPNSVEDPSRLGDIATHEVPKVRRVLRGLTIAQLDVVSPYEQLASQVNIRTFKFNASQCYKDF